MSFFDFPSPALLHGAGYYMATPDNKAVWLSGTKRGEVWGEAKMKKETFIVLHYVLNCFRFT